MHIIMKKESKILQMLCLTTFTTCLFTKFSTPMTWHHVAFNCIMFGKGVFFLVLAVKYSITICFWKTYRDWLNSKFVNVPKNLQLFQFLEQEAQQGVTPLPNVWPVEGAVEFRNVSMRYRKHLELVLRNVSFIINPRENVGVVGRTGAGKCVKFLILVSIWFFFKSWCFSAR